MNQPTPSEIVSIAAQIFGSAFKNAPAEERREMIANAFWFWRQARDVIHEAPLAKREIVEIEHLAVMSTAVRSDAEWEALALAAAAGEDVVTWTDASLWAAVGEKMNSGDTPASVAERLHHKFKYRMKTKGRKGEVESQGRGVKRALAVEILRDDGWTPGRRSVDLADSERLPERLPEKSETRQRSSRKAGKTKRTQR